MKTKTKMIVMTIPKIIPPANEAPSNFLPPVGAGVVCFKGTSVTVGDCGVVLFVVDTVVLVDGVVVPVVVDGVGDSLLAVELFVPMLTSAGVAV